MASLCLGALQAFSARRGQAAELETLQVQNESAVLVLQSEVYAGATQLPSLLHTRHGRDCSESMC